VHAQVAPAAAAAVDVQGVHSAAAAEPAQAGGAGWRRGAALAAGLAGFAAMGSVALAEDESEHGLHAPRHPWPHDGIFSAYDHAAIRRGHQVYTQVCAACHSMYQIHYRDLVGVAYTEEEVKSMAAEARWPLAHFILRRSGARALGLPAAPDGAALARRSRSQTAPTTRASSMSGLAA
jgi:cytochrome c1